MKIKNVVCTVLCFAVAFAGLTAWAVPEVVQGVNNNAVLQKVNVSGTMGAEYSGKYVTFFAVNKGVNPADATKDDFIYIKQLTLGEDGSYEFGFQVNNAAEFDVYVNEAGGGLVKCQPEKTNILLEATVEKATVSEGVYNIKASLENTFGYDNLEVAMIIGYYADGRMVDVSCKSFVMESERIEEAFENITAPENVTQIKFFIFMEKNLSPVTEAMTVYDKTMNCAVGSNTLGSIFFDKNAEFDLVLENLSDNAAQFEVAASVRSENGDVGEAESLSVSVAKNEKKTVKLSPEVLRYGFNTLVVNIKNTDTGVKYQAKKEFSVVHAPADGVSNPKTAFSDNTASHDPANGSSAYGYEDEKLELFKKAGFSATRYGSYWDYVERQQGVFDFNRGNHKLVRELLAEKGIDVINLLYSGNKGNQAWEVDAAPTTETGREKFANYAYESTKAVLGISDRVEVWNEYNHEFFNPSGATVDDYIELLKVTKEAVEDANPEAKVYGLGSVTTVANMYEWIEEFLQKGGQNYCDGFSFHPYATSHPSAEAIAVFDKCWELFEKYNATDKDIILTEMGWHSNNIDEITQASYEIQFAASVYDRVETISWWCAQEQQGDDDGENKFGMIRAWDKDWCAPYEPFSAKPKFLAHANFNRLMTGAAGTGSQIISDTVQIKSFENEAGQSISVIWNEAGNVYKDVTIKTDCDTAVVCDIYGNETNISAPGGFINLSVGQTPIYLIGSYSTIEEM